MAKSNAKAGSQEMTDVLNQSETFIKKYKKALLVALIAIVVIIAGFIFYKNVTASRSEEAATALAKVQDLFAQQQYEKALKGEGAAVPGFIQLASDYSGTPSGNLANYYAGLCYAKMNKWQDAVKYLEEFDAQDDLIPSPLSQVALGDAYANLKQYDKAVEAFKKGAKLADKAANGGINYSVSPLALKKAGIILNEQGKKDEALEVFKEIKEKYVNAPIVASGQIDEFIELATK